MVRMALALTDEHRQLAETIRSWARRTSPPEAVREAADGGDRGAARYTGTLAPSLADSGLFGLHVPEPAGGQGYGLAELAVAVEALGAALVPGGYLPTVLASAALVTAGADGTLLGPLADGSQGGAVALGAALAGTPGEDGGLVADGETGPVLGGSLAGVIILPVRTPDGETWVAADAASLQISAIDSLDLTRPLAAVRAEHAVIPAARRLPGLDRPAVQGLAAALFAAEASGIADWAVATAADYAKFRHQFGRPIGQFQAVKHRCAWMLAAAEQAAAAAWAAVAAGPPGPGQPEGSRAGQEFAAALAALVALDNAVNCVHDCIQVLGGIGYTWEHPAHLYYRRALTLRALAGPPEQHAERAARLALTGARPALHVDLGAQEDEGFRAGVRSELSAISRLAHPEKAERMADGGWVMPHLPPPWGRGASAHEQLVIEQEMRAAGLKAPSLGIGAWVVPALVQHGTQQQRQRFLPPTLRGELIWCQLFSEPGAGSDLAGLSTKAVRADGGWRLTGQKIWTSLAREAGWAICLARTDPSAPKHDGLTYFLVDMRTDGVDVRPLREITGDSVFNQVFLDEVFVPDDCVVGEVNGGWQVARTTLANERASLASSWTFGCGADELLAVARAARQAPLASVGRLVCEGQAIDSLGIRATLKQLSGTKPGATGSVRKLLGMRHAQQVARLCWEMTGPSGALGARYGPEVDAAVPNGPHWARQVLLTEALTIGGGTTDIQLNIIAERILGLPRDPEP
jgi:alkylation response protein AidB-like acyl-CoA dehydrogenase